MNISVFDLFNIGIGPSSSHCIGPMRAAFTGKGHGTTMALMMGLAWNDPETIEPTAIPGYMQTIAASGNIITIEKHSFAFDATKNIILHFNDRLADYSNGMVFKAYATDQAPIFEQTYYSTGGGFIVNASDKSINVDIVADKEITYPFDTADQLLNHCKTNSKTIAEIAFTNELYWRSKEQITAQCLLGARLRLSMLRLSPCLKRVNILSVLIMRLKL